MRILYFLLISVISSLCAAPSNAHTHKAANGVEYDYTVSDAKDCCNNGDCRPAVQYYSDGTHYWFYVEPKPAEKKHGYVARWVKVPVAEVRVNDLFGDRKAHWCGDLYAAPHYNTRCAFVPPKREMTGDSQPFLDATLRLESPAFRGAFDSLHATRLGVGRCCVFSDPELVRCVEKRAEDDDGSERHSDSTERETQAPKLPRWLKDKKKRGKPEEHNGNCSNFFHIVILP